MSNDKNINLDILNSLSPEERAAALQILQEYAVSGESVLLDDLTYADFEEIPVDISTFLHDRHYLGNGLYDSEGRFTLFPFWEEQLKDIFPDNISTKYNTLVFSGAIGIGKSFVAVICLLYVLYRLLCLKDPYTYFGLQPIDKLSISFLNITLENAKGVALDKMNQLILSSEWFMSHGDMAGKTNLMYRPEKHIEFVLASSNNQIIGRCIIASFEDEVNFATFSDPEKQKKKMMKLITQLDARMRSRFLRGTYLPTLNIIASSKDTSQSFLDAYVKQKRETESKTTLIVDKPQWVVDSRKDSPNKFYVGIGSRLLPNELFPLDVTEDEINIARSKGYSIWKVPMGYLETFQTNLDEAICSIIGISTDSSLKYISGERLEAAKVDTYVNPFIKDIIEVGNGPNDLLQYANFFDKRLINPDDVGKPLFLHLDLSISGDKTGIAGVWITGKQPNIKQLPTAINPETGLPDAIDYSLDLKYKLAFSVSVKAPKGCQVSFEKTRNFIRWLRDQGFAIKVISADTFNSAPILQELKSDGFKTEILSVDRVDARTKIQPQYAYFKSALYERRVEIYKKCDLLTEEILQLERLGNGKVEHQDAGKHGCFTGETKVSLVDGRELSMLDLVKEFEAGRQNYVYSFNETTKTIEPKPIEKAWRTRQNAELVEVLLDNGERLKCTPDHRFMLRDGTYKEAKDLLENDSLMPLYRRFPSIAKMNKYRMYYEPIEDKWHYEHRQFATEVLDTKYLVHHKDCNPANNSPTNLIWCSKQAHSQIPAELETGAWSVTARNRRRASLKNWYKENTAAASLKNHKAKLTRLGITEEEFKKKTIEKQQRVSQYWENIERNKQQKIEYINNIEQMFDIVWNELSLAEKDSYAVKYQRATNADTQQKITEAIKQRHAEGRHTNAYAAMASHNKASKKLKELCPIVDYDKFIEIFGFDLRNIPGGTGGKRAPWVTKYRKIMCKTILNHKVKAVNIISERADVYDLTIKDNHNFALSAGIFVHNSKDQCDAFVGALWDASRFAEEYSYSYGDNLSATLNANISAGNEVSERQLLIENFEAELFKIKFDGEDKPIKAITNNDLNFTDMLDDGIFIL